MPGINEVLLQLLLLRIEVRRHCGGSSQRVWRHLPVARPAVACALQWHKETHDDMYADGDGQVSALGTTKNMLSAAVMHHLGAARQHQVLMLQEQSVIKFQCWAPTKTRCGYLQQPGEEWLQWGVKDGRLRRCQWTARVAAAGVPAAGALQAQRGYHEDMQTHVKGHTCVVDHQHSWFKTHLCTVLVIHGSNGLLPGLRLLPSEVRQHRKGSSRRVRRRPPIARVAVACALQWHRQHHEDVQMAMVRLRYWALNRIGCQLQSCIISASRGSFRVLLL
jgi:hypothetical protein